MSLLALPEISLIPQNIFTSSELIGEFSSFNLNRIELIEIENHWNQLLDVVGVCWVYNTDTNIFYGYCGLRLNKSKTFIDFGYC